MALVRSEMITYKEFLRLREESDEILEYIDGIVYMSPSPSVKHQRISGRLHAKLFSYLEGKTCEVFHAPFDVVLKKEDLDSEKLVIPDLVVICDPKGFTENKYIGVPPLIVEILSPSNQGHDLVTKLNLYMKYGVLEYWIINPMLQTIMVYHLNEEGFYEQQEIRSERGMVHSQVLKGFQVDVEMLFA